MSQVKRIVENTKYDINKAQFREYYSKLNDMYDLTFKSNREIAELMNFEFNTLISDIDVIKFLELSIDEEDKKIEIRNLGIIY